MEFSPHTLRFLCWGSLAASSRNSGLQNFPARRLLFPQPPGLSLLLTTRPALPFRSLPPCRSPIWAIKAAIYAGSLRASCAASSWVLSQDAQLWLSLWGRGSTAKRDSLQGSRGCQREHGVGVGRLTLQSQSSLPGL